MIGRRQLAIMGASSLIAPAVTAATVGPRRLRLGIGSGWDNPFGAAARILAEQIGGRTQGRLAVDVYANATLGNDEAMLAATRAGALDLTIVSSALLAAFAPEVGLLDLPFLFESRQRAHAALDGQEGKELAQLVQASGAALLAWGENGVRHLTGHRPLRGPADIRGLKLRVLPSPLLVNAFRCMGADAASVPFSQLYEALLTGGFEAQENPLQLILSARLYEVQSHVTLTAHAYSAMAILASADLLEDLAALDRDAVTAACLAAALGSREFVARTDAAAADGLRAKGMAIIADADRGALRDAAAPAEAEVAARFGADRISRLRRA